MGESRGQVIIKTSKQIPQFLKDKENLRTLMELNRQKLDFRAK
jgi:hypothetical protein